MKNLKFNGLALLPGFQPGEIVPFDKFLAKHGAFESTDEPVSVPDIAALIDSDALKQKASDAVTQIVDTALIALLLKSVSGTKLTPEEKVTVREAMLEVEKINSTVAEIEQKLETGESVELPAWAL